MNINHTKLPAQRHAECVRVRNKSLPLYASLSLCALPPARPRSIHLQEAPGAALHSRAKITAIISGSTAAQSQRSLTGASTEPQRKESALRLAARAGSCSFAALIASFRGACADSRARRRRQGARIPGGPHAHTHKPRS
ncbi:hypothetical protein SRHO_G00068370 [Serrasalmus rhombeus]